MRISTKTQLALGVASAAFIAGFATPAAAQCTTDTTTATCTGTTSTDAANAAMGTIGGDDVTLDIAGDAQVDRGASGDLAPPQTGSVAIDNAGTIGTVAAPAGVFYIGDVANATNSFSLNNDGTITGGVYAGNVGGDIDLASAGTIGGSVYLSGEGDVSADIGGNVGTPGTETSSSALGDVSAYSAGHVTPVTTATGPITTGGVTTTTSTYSEDNETGAASVTIGADAHVGNVTIEGIEGAAATIAGAVGAEDQLANLNVYSGGYHYSSTSTSTTSGTVSTNDSATHYEDMGGDTTVAIADTGSVSGGVNAYGVDSVAVTINGTVGSEGAPSGVLVTAYGQTDDSASNSSYDSATGDQSSESSSTTRYSGGPASVTVGETGVVNGYVSAVGDGDTMVTNAGAITSSVSTNSGGTSTDYALTSSDTFATDADGNFNQTHDDSSNSDSMATGGVAAIANAASGVIGGSATAQGVGGATTENAGEIDGDAFAGSDTVVGANRDYVNHAVTVNNADGSGSNLDTGTYHQDYIEVGSDTAIINAADATIGGGAIANGVGDASVTNGGEIDGAVTANARGSDDVYDSSYENESTYNTSGIVTASSFDNTSGETVTQIGGAASVSNAAGGLIGDDPYAPVFVQIGGTTGASLDNAGRINGNVSLDTTASNTTSSYEDAGTNTYDDMGNPLAQTSDTSNASTETAVGGDLGFDNAAGGLITGSVTVIGDGDATLSNAGAVIGTTTAASSRTVQDYASTTHSATTYADEGSVTSDYANETDVTDSLVGGDVTGSYAGTNGALQFAPTGGASDGSVTQIAAGDSMATVTGSIFGNFTGNATSNIYTSVAKDSGETNYGTTGLVTDSSSTQSQVTNRTYGDGASALVVDGGQITGSISLFADKGVTASFDGGAEIDGSINAALTAYDAIDTDIENATTATYDDAGALASSTTTHNYDESDTLGSGAIDVAIGEATVGGSVYQQGAGGTNTVSLGAQGEVGGSISLINYGDTASINQQSTTVTTPDGSTEDDVDKRIYTPGGGDVSATIDGVIGNTLGGAYAIGDGPADASVLGGLNLQTGAGNATATLTGQIGGEIYISAGGGDSNAAIETDDHYENGALLRKDFNESYTSVGGTASLTVDSSADNIANLIPAGLGDVYVVGRQGSTLDIGAGSILAAATDGSFVQVGGTFADTEDSSTTDYVAATNHSVSNSTIVGGDATLTNNGTIGYGGGDYSGAAAQVLVDSITNATLTNSGNVFGSVGVYSLGEDQTTTTDAVNIGDVTEIDTIDRTYVPVGGTATLANTGLITGGVAMGAADGTIINDRVIRGGIQLGASLDNYATNATDTATQVGEETVTEAYNPFAQIYTVEQNGLLGTGIAVGGAMSALDDTVQTSDITATINLNDGSVTAGGIYGEVDADTGARLAHTSVNLDGSGYLGLDAQDVLDLGDVFGDVDPQTAGDSGLSAYAGGVRVVGVDKMSKTGGGAFAIFGQTYAPASNSNATPDFTLDLGEFDVTDGEVQLGVTDETNGDRGTFGIKGDLVNDGTLVLGRRVMLEQPLFASNLTSQGTEAIDGVNVYQQGNFTQGASGRLVVGMAPALVRYYASTVGDGSTSNDLLGVGQGGVSQGYFTSYTNLPGAEDLGTSFVTLDGDLDLAGTVNVVAPKGGIYTDGQSLDLFSVSGTVTDSASVDTGWQSAFVSFGLNERTDGGRTVVSLTAARQGYDTVATNSNAAAAGAALTAAIPGVVDALTADAGGAGAFGSVGDFDMTQDLATIIAGFDSQLDASSAAEALDELASADFYGSLAAIDTTAPFVDTLSNRLLPANAQGFNLWLQPSGTFGRFDGSSNTGARPIRSDTYGGSGGFAVATGTGGEFGLGFGYGRTDAKSRTNPVKANADTYMVGAYARQDIGAFTVAADGVFGWSNWNATRIMPLFSRTATADFDSKQVRFDLRGEYRFDLGAAYLAPFGELSLRHYHFDGFDEGGAGAVGLSINGHSKTVFTPTIGAKLGTSFTTGLATLRPEASISYSFQGDINGDRDVAYLGAPDQSFRLQGVDPDGYASFGLGLFADIGQNSGAFIRGSYATGGGNDVASLSVGVKIGF